MTIKVFVLIETQVGKIEEVAKAITKLDGVQLAEPVTGPYDIITSIEVANLNALGNLVRQIHSVSGVTRTTTCVAIKH